MPKRCRATLTIPLMEREAITIKNREWPVIFSF